MIDREQVLLPGYIFFFMESGEPDVAKLRRLNGFIRLLSYEDEEFELKGKDKAFAEMLLSRNGVLGKTPVYREGDRLVINKGLFKGIETEILRVNRRNHRMLIEIPFTDTKVQTWVEYEEVDRDSENE